LVKVLPRVEYSVFLPSPGMYQRIQTPSALDGLILFLLWLGLPPQMTKEINSRSTNAVRMYRVLYIRCFLPSRPCKRISIAWSTEVEKQIKKPLERVSFGDNPIQ
jgi:hypothetical protein